MTPLTEAQKVRIVNNVVKATKDIKQLNKTGYNFLYLASGFIAHYSLFGFIEHYSQYDLKKDILQNANMNMWKNFTPNDKDYHYYQAKADVYRRILEKIA